MMKKMFVLFASLFSIGQGQLGQQLDDHGCVTDGGYQWCEATQSCIRPWMTPCVQQTKKTKMCPESPLQLCRMMCPNPSCQKDQCAFRVGSCCDYMCKHVETGEIQPKQGHRRNQVSQIPTGCVEWFDGCNTCHRNGPTDPMACTMMMCFRQGTQLCRSYARGYQPIPQIAVDPLPPTQRGVFLNQRCASGFCENPNDCPRCADGYQCHIPDNVVCPGTCYGICHQVGHRRLQINNTCKHNSDCEQSSHCGNYVGTDEEYVGTCIPYQRENQMCGFLSKKKHCAPKLECYYRRGSIDIPGICKPICEYNDPFQMSIRDHYGNCIETNCSRWYDGCNVCSVSKYGHVSCSKKFCRYPQQSHCVSLTSPQLV